MKRILFMLVLCSLSAGIVYAMVPQPAAGTRTITGKIKSECEDQPIPGVNIVELGTTNGTTSDVDGNYSITVNDDPNTVLVYTFLGYQSVQTAIGSRTVINITLPCE